MTGRNKCEIEAKQLELSKALFMQTTGIRLPRHAGICLAAIHT
jgi:hypothetical protein